MKKLSQTDPIITDALNFCRDSLQITPKDPDILLLRGIVYLTSDRPKSAVLDFSDVIDQVPINERSYFLRSKAYYELEQFDLALKDCMRAMREGDRKSYSYSDEHIETLTSTHTDVKDVNNITNQELINTLVLLADKYSDSQAVRNLFRFHVL